MEQNPGQNLCGHDVGPPPTGPQYQCTGAPNMSQVGCELALSTGKSE